MMLPLSCTVYSMLEQVRSKDNTVQWLLAQHGSPEESEFQSREIGVQRSRMHILAFYVTTYVTVVTYAWGNSLAWQWHTFYMTKHEYYQIALKLLANPVLYHIAIAKLFHENDWNLNICVRTLKCSLFMRNLVSNWQFSFVTLVIHFSVLYSIRFT